MLRKAYILVKYKNCPGWAPFEFPQRINPETTSLVYINWYIGIFLCSHTRIIYDFLVVMQISYIIS